MTGQVHPRRRPSARAMWMLRDKIRAVTTRSRTERPVTDVVAELNLRLRRA